jgi:hypothetical protein
MKFELIDGRVAGSKEKNGKICILGPIKGSTLGDDYVHIEMSTKDAKHLQDWFNVLWPPKKLTK